MNLEIYFAPGACSFVPHVALEAIRAATGQASRPPNPGLDTYKPA